MDGTIQEAGSFVWCDGTTSCATLDESDFAHGYDWARAVDYCSAASLLVRRSTWDRVSGFDEIFYPAYYEDLDLCLKIQEDTARRCGSSQRPSCTTFVLQVRLGPICEFLMHRSRALLKQRWSRVLERHVQRTDDHVRDEEIATWMGMGQPNRLLVIDDRIPARPWEPASGRIRDALSELLSSSAYFVSFFASAASDGDWAELSCRGLRLLKGELDSHLRHPGTSYDVVIISRPHNYGRFGALVRECRPQCGGHLRCRSALLSSDRTTGGPIR